MWTHSYHWHNLGLNYSFVDFLASNDDRNMNAKLAPSQAKLQTKMLRRDLFVSNL